MAKSKRPYNYSGVNTKKNSTKKSVSKKKKDDLEATSTRIRIDDTRLNDLDSLDTSFLEGRLNKKVKSNKKAKEKILNDKKSLIVNLGVLKTIFFVLAFLCVVLLVFLIFNDKSFDKSTKKAKVEVTDNATNSENLIDDNYLFIGDFYTEKFNFDDLDYHYVKESDDDLTTEGVLDDLKGRIYDYNPSHIFINLGINDLSNDESSDKIIENLGNIIDGIKENRPYAKVYVESVYPINKDVDDYDDDIIDDSIDNDNIKDLNGEIKKLVEKKKVNYLDLYSLLEKDDKLNEDYTDNGVYLNDDGYKVIMDKINKILG